MRRIGIVEHCLKRWTLFSCFWILSSALFFMTNTATSWAADKIAKIEVFPPTPYDGYIIYESLAVFWLFIIGLIVIIRMKLREIERIQEMGVEKEDPDAPMLR
jgi:dipeptide/tripeptide permease